MFTILTQSFCLASHQRNNNRTSFAYRLRNSANPKYVSFNVTSPSDLRQHSTSCALPRITRFFLTADLPNIFCTCATLTLQLSITSHQRYFCATSTIHLLGKSTKGVLLGYLIVCGPRSHTPSNGHKHHSKSTFEYVLYL